MDWQTPEDSVPSGIITEANRRSLLGKPAASGAWRIGDPEGERRFANLGTLRLEHGELPGTRVAYESWGALNEARDNAVLIVHALTGDSHVLGAAGPGHATAGWWQGIVGPGKAIDTDRWFVVCSNMLGGCQGSTGPSSLAPDGTEWGSRFPYLTVRDQVAAQVALSDRLRIDRWAAVIGGSAGGMQAVEWAATHPDRVERLGVLASAARTGADQIAANTTQSEAVRMDPGFHGGDYYDLPDGEGPHRGLALARRMALLSYRSATELNGRFSRSWQSAVSPYGGEGRFAVESYLDFHGNKFTRRFDANSYLVLLEAMNSHDVGRDRGGLASALSRVTARSLVLAIDSDRLFPPSDQELLAAHLPEGLDGRRPVVVSSEYGHDGFLIEEALVGDQLRRLLAS